MTTQSLKKSWPKLGVRSPDGEGVRYPPMARRHMTGGGESASRYLSCRRDVHGVALALGPTPRFDANIGKKI